MFCSAFKLFLHVTIDPSPVLVRPEWSLAAKFAIDSPVNEPGEGTKFPPDKLEWWFVLSC